MHVFFPTDGETFSVSIISWSSFKLLVGIISFGCDDSSIVGFSSTFVDEDEAVFLPRADWRVGVIGTTDDLGLPRVDLPFGSDSTTSGTVISTAGGGGGGAVVDTEPSLPAVVSIGDDNTGSGSVGLSSIGSGAGIDSSTGLTSLIVSTGSFSLSPLTCTADESPAPIFSLVPLDVILLTAESFCPLTTGSDGGGGITFSLSSFICCEIFCWRY